MRAYTPADEKGVKAAAQSFRTNPEFDTYEVLTAMGTGEAIISVLDADGIPGVVKKCKILPPQSMMGPISDEEKKQEILKSNLYLRYKDEIDRDSAYEFMERMKKEEASEKQEQAAAAAAAKEAAAAEKEASKRAAAEAKAAEKQAAAAEREAARRRKSVANAAANTIGRELGKTLGKTVGGSFGKKLGGNVGASLARNILGTFLK